MEINRESSAGRKKIYGDIITMPMQEGLFRDSGNNIGLACPFKPIICEVGRCEQCPIYLDWQKLGELIHICAWCSKVKSRNANPFGQPVVSGGICLECQQKYFPETLTAQIDRRGRKDGSRQERNR